MQALNVGQPWSYNLIFTECTANNDTITLVCGYLLNQLNLNLGEYGSPILINLGRNGITYYLLKRVFLQAYNLTLKIPNIQKQLIGNVLRYILEPLSNIPDYRAAGPGGQGDPKQNLNRAINSTKERIATVTGTKIPQFLTSSTSCPIPTFTTIVSKCLTI